MTSKDMQDLVGQPGTPRDDVAKSKAVKLTKAQVKRPMGMSREVFNLMNHTPNADELHTAIPTSTASFKENLKKMIQFRKVRKWQWKEFENQARTDGFKMRHWEREDRNPSEPYIFARMNKHLELPKPTADEYERLFVAEKWTFESTEHLFDLCERFDLRWIIIDSRFDREKYGQFTMEDLKERYYKIANGLRKERNIDEPLFAFDVENERKRKEQLEILWNRTEEEIQEEEMLRAQMRRIDSRRKDRERRTQDLQRLINVVERSASPEPNGVSLNAQHGRDRRRPQRQPRAQLIAAHLLSTEGSNLRFVEFRSAGPHLRSHEMKLPSNVGQKKLKAIDTAVEKYQLPIAPPAHEDVVKAYNELRSRVVLAQELRNILQGTQ